MVRSGSGAPLQIEEHGREAGAGGRWARAASRPDGEVQREAEAVGEVRREAEAGSGLADSVEVEGAGGRGSGHGRVGKRTVEEWGRTWG